MDWEFEISKLVFIKEKIYELDSLKLWEYHLPNVSAKEKQIDNLQKECKNKLPSKYIDFLKYANGWKSFYQNVDLFGISDFHDSKRQRYVGTIYSQLPDSIKDKEKLVPIASTYQDIDLFCINIETGEVIWFAGGEIDKFNDFNDFFLAMIDYNREELRDLQGK